MQQITLKDINIKLKGLGLPVSLTQADASALLGSVKRENFIEAIARSEKGDKQTIVWLGSVLKGFEVQKAVQQHTALPVTPPTSKKVSDQQSQEYTSDDSNDVIGDGNAYLSCHVYAKSALCFGADKTRRGVATIALDAASGTGPKQYNWNDKVRIQLTSKELPMVAAVLLGYRKRCEYKNHGPDNNKGFSLEDQGDKVFCRVFTKGAAHAVPISSEDRFHVGALVLGQLKNAFPNLDEISINALLRVSR